MRQVMPSQLVNVIDQHFAHAQKSQLSILLTASSSTKLQGIVDLLDLVPDQLLIPPAADYANLILARSTIRSQLAIWTSRGEVGGMPFIEGYDPVTVLRRILVMCPDEYPPPATTELKFIPDADLRDSIRKDVGAAQRALEGAEWKAATVLAGSAIEVLLHWKLGLQAAPALARAIAASGVTPLPDLDRWNLNQFILVARALPVIGEDTKTSALLAKDYRNLIHPGRSARLGIRCDKGTAHSAIGALYQTIRDLE